MVGLRWYLDVLGSESHVLVLVFGGFLKKNREGGKTIIEPSPQRRLIRRDEAKWPKRPPSGSLR